MGVFKNLLVGGRPVLTTDHKTDENAHSFYLNPTGYKTLQTTSSQANYWAKIGTVTMQAQYKHFEAKISFMSGSGTSNTQRGEWYVKIIQTGALGTAPIIKSRLKNYSYISVDQVKIVTVQNDSVQTKMELYIKITNQFDEMYFLPYHCVYDKTSMFVRWWKYEDASPLITPLPAGTTTDAIEDISFSLATNNAAQSITATTWTKVLFQTETNDFKNEYDNANSKFIPNQNGVYLVSACVRMSQSGSPPSTANYRSLGIYVNGALVKRLTNGNGQFLQGSVPIKVNAFDYIEVYVYSPDAVTIEQNSTDTYFTVKS